MGFAGSSPLLPGTEKSFSKVLTITELTRRIRGSIEREFFNIWIVGEVSNFKRATSGHVYLTLKDSGAQLQAVIFKSLASRLKFEVKDGMQIVAFGSITVYDARGQYQLIVENVEPKGIGGAAVGLFAVKGTIGKGRVV